MSSQKIFCWYNFFDKNLYQVGCVSVCFKSKVIIRFNLSALAPCPMVPTSPKRGDKSILTEHDDLKHKGEIKMGEKFKICNISAQNTGKRKIYENPLLQFVDLPFFPFGPKVVGRSQVENNENIYVYTQLKYLRVQNNVYILKHKDHSRKQKAIQI